MDGIDRSAGERGRPVLAFAMIGCSLVLVLLNVGAINIALPLLSREFEIEKADVVWVTVGFQVALMATAIPIAALSEIVGYRRVYVTGLAIFVAASAACSMATSFETLVAARIVQGLGAAGVSAVNSAIVRTVVPIGMMGRAVSVMAVIVAATYGVGPMIGSFILEIADWHWLFLYNVPLGVVVILLSTVSLPPDRNLKHAFDIPSAVLCVAMLGSAVVGLDQLGKAADWLRGSGILAASALCAVVLVARQRGLAVPLFPVDLLRRASFALPIGASFLMFAAQGLAYVTFPFLFIDQFRLSVVDAGLMMSVWPFGLLVASPLVGYLADRWHRLPLGAIGSFVSMAGIVLTLGYASEGDHFAVTVCLALTGVGFAIFQTPNSRAIILGAPLARMGGASGVQAVARSFGQTVGAALVGICFHLFTGQGAGAALTLSAGLAAVAGGVNVYRALRLDPEATAGR